MRYVLAAVLGMFLMYIVLKITSSRSVNTKSDVTPRLKQLVLTPQFSNLLKTNEARELIKTPEFRAFVKTLANEQIKTISTSLVSYEPK